MCGQWLFLGYAVSYMIRKSAERSMPSLSLVFRRCFRRCFRDSSRQASSSSEPLRFWTIWPSRSCVLEITLF
jgi:hypothetical protein